MGRAYKKLIHEWKHVLPTQSVCLRVPIDLPETADDAAVAAEQRSNLAKDAQPETEPSTPDNGGAPNN